MLKNLKSADHSGGCGPKEPGTDFVTVRILLALCAAMTMVRTISKGDTMSLMLIAVKILMGNVKKKILQVRSIKFNSKFTSAFSELYFLIQFESAIYIAGCTSLMPIDISALKVRTIEGFALLTVCCNCSFMYALLRRFGDLFVQVHCDNQNRRARL